VAESIRRGGRARKLASEEAFDPARHYDRVTEAWTLLLGDDLHYGVFASGDEDLSSATSELTRLMAERTQLEPGLEVLDVGCGTGAPACALAAQHQVRVTGITTSDVGAQLARKKADAEGIGHLVQFELRDGTDNGFPDESFDRVWALESSHLMRRDSLMAECARVLRRGGRLSLCDIVLRRELSFWQSRRLRAPLVRMHDVFGNAHTGVDRVERYVALAAQYGLLVDERLDLTDATRPTFDRWRQNAQRNRQQVVELIGEEGWRRFIEASDLLERLWGHGALGYALIVATKP
jgi:cyclopropane fatty-acyl-phospholipid synthase-like methyltransferase